MLPLPVSVFITQIVGLLGVAAATRLVVLIAYYLKDLDFRLMYHENIFRQLGYCTDYNTSDSRKGLVFCMSFIAILLSFIPTFLSFGADTKDTGYATYTNINTSNLIQMNDLGASVKDRQDKPLFTEFYNTSTHTPASSTGNLMENYLISENKMTQMNPSGVWYSVPAVHFEPQRQNHRWSTNKAYPMKPQTLNDTGIFFVEEIDKKSSYTIPRPSKPSKFNKSYAISYNNKVNPQGSSTIEDCAANDSLDSNLVRNITVIDGHQVQGARSMNRTCYPITDPSLWLISFKEESNDTGVDSLLNSNEDLYFRSLSLNPQSSASYSMGVVARNWNKLERTVAMVKKSAHITVFYSDFNRSLTPDNCVPRIDSNRTTFHQDINMIACQLASQAKQNPSLPILQATRRFYTANKMINSVYTYIKKDNGHGIMIDLTLYSAFFVEGSTDSNFAPEIFIAYQQVKKADLNTADFEQVLQGINPFPDPDDEYGQNTIADLVLIGSRLFGFSTFKKEFLKTTALVSYPVRVSTPWIALTVSFAVLFILIIAVSTAMTPEAYRTDLRSLLVHTLLSQSNRMDAGNDSPASDRENAGLLTKAVCLDSEKSFNMDQNPIVLSENIPMMEQEAESSA